MNAKLWLDHGMQILKLTPKFYKAENMKKMPAWQVPNNLGLKTSPNIDPTPADFHQKLYNKQMPLIGLTGTKLITNDELDFPLQALRHTYFKAIEQAGGTPILLYNSTNTQTLDHYANLIDGIIFTGGGDIDPSKYQQDINGAGLLDQHIDKDRDFAEFYLLEKMIQKQKPIFGICRGLQLINIYHGGTLNQHLPQDFPEQHMHPDKYPSLNRYLHQIKITPATKLAKILKKSSIEVNSGHHQHIDKVGDGLVIAARSQQGIIEAIEHPHYPFMLAVQWHPEANVTTDMLSQALIKSFIRSTY